MTVAKTGVEPHTRSPWPRSRRQASIARVALYLFCGVLGVLFMLPFAWTVASSFKAPWEMYQFPPVLFPEQLQFANYAQIFQHFPFIRWYWNTLVVVTLTTLGVVITSSIVAYGFARFDFRFKNVLFILMLSTMMLPHQVSLIPRYILFFHLDWLDTLKPLWVPHWFGGTPFAIFLMRQFLRTLPRELDEAAIIDGASYFRVFWNILMPLCKPALATVAIITMIASWNEFLDPVVFLDTPANFTIAIGLWFFKAQPMVDVPTAHLLMAASVTSLIPPIVLFFAFQRYFVRGIAMTGMKQ